MRAILLFAIFLTVLSFIFILSFQCQLFGESYQLRESPPLLLPPDASPQPRDPQFRLRLFAAAQFVMTQYLLVLTGGRISWLEISSGSWTGSCAGVDRTP
mgnify:CR=1 FL=1